MVITIVEDAVSSARAAVCETCPEKMGLFCKQCMCVIAAKTVFAKESCPLGKWAPAAPRKTPVSEDGL